MVLSSGSQQALLLSTEHGHRADGAISGHHDQVELPQPDRAVRTVLPRRAIPEKTSYHVSRDSQHVHTMSPGEKRISLQLSEKCAIGRPSHFIVLFLTHLEEQEDTQSSEAKHVL